MPPVEQIERVERKGDAWGPRQLVPHVRVDQPIRGDAVGDHAGTHWEFANGAALDDFDQKFLSRKVVAPHEKGIGFLYLHIPETKDIRGYLAKSRVYIPDVQRYDSGASMIYFEIELEPALRAAP